MIQAIMLILSLQMASDYSEYQDLYYMSLFQFYYSDEFVMMPFCTDSTPELAARAEEYATRWSEFETGYDFSACQHWVDSVTTQKRAGHERGIVSLILHPEVHSLALIYLSKAPVPYEWEGDSYPIGREALHAMSFLRRNPGTPLEPYIILELMYLLRAQEECITVFEGLPADSIIALYDSLLQVALDHEDPLVNYFAGEIDSEAFVYVPH